MSILYELFSYQAGRCFGFIATIEPALSCALLNQGETSWGFRLAVVPLKCKTKRRTGLWFQLRVLEMCTGKVSSGGCERTSLEYPFYSRKLPPANCFSSLFLPVSQSLDYDSNPFIPKTSNTRYIISSLT